MELRSSVACYWVLYKDNITAVNGGMTNVDSKPGLWIPFGGSSIAILESFVKNINWASPRVKIMNV